MLWQSYKLLVEWKSMFECVPVKKHRVYNVVLIEKGVWTKQGMNYFSAVMNVFGSWLSWKG